MWVTEHTCGRALFTSTSRIDYAIKLCVMRGADVTWGVWRNAAVRRTPLIRCWSGRWICLLAMPATDSSSVAHKSSLSSSSSSYERAACGCWNALPSRTTHVDDIGWPCVRFVVMASRSSLCIDRHRSTHSVIWFDQSISREVVGQWQLLMRQTDRQAQWVLQLSGRPLVNTVIIHFTLTQLTGCSEVNEMFEPSSRILL